MHEKDPGTKRRFRRNMLAVSLMLLAISLVFFASMPREPRYEGRALSAWLADLDVSIRQRLPKEQSTELRAQKQKKRAVAEEAIRQIGTNSLDSLIRMLKAKDSNLKQLQQAWASKLPWIKIRVRAASEQRHLANEAFRILGPTAEPAIAALIRMLEERDEVEVPITTEALVAIGPKVVLPLRIALTNQIARVQNAALGVLSEPQLAPHAKSAVPEIVKCLGATSAGVRYVAAFALGEIRTEPALVVPALVDRLGDTNTYVRAHAVLALGKLAGESKAAVPMLRRLLDDPEESVRSTTTKVLMEIDPESVMHP